MTSPAFTAFSPRAPSFGCEIVRSSHQLKPPVQRWQNEIVPHSSTRATMGRSARARAFAGAFAVLLLACAALAASPTPADAPSTPSPPADRRRTTASAAQRGSIRSFFRRLDADGDGQIQTDELSAYVGDSVGGKDFDTEGEIRAAVVGVTELIDGHDSGSDISEEELLRHLTRSSNQLLTPRRVELWVRHGLGFPQYAEAFGENAITALDFPELIANDGAVLREDLGVKSTFHLGKITRALKRQILGLGSPPSEPLDVRAVVINHTAVAVQWRPPAESGVPPVHAYIVQTRTDDVPKWETAGRADAEDGTHVVALAPDASHRTHTAHQFRVAAWGAHGSSEYSAASAPVAVDRAGARVADGRDGSTRRARGGEDASERGGELYRAVASTFLLAGLVARFLFSSASFFGGWGTVRALAWRGAAWALRRARRASGETNERRADAANRARGGEAGPARASLRRGEDSASVTNAAVDVAETVAARATPRAAKRDAGGGATSTPSQLKSNRSWAFADAMAAAVAAGVAPDVALEPDGCGGGYVGNAGAFGGGAGGGSGGGSGGVSGASSPRARSPPPEDSPPPPAPPEEGAARVFEIVASEPKKKGRCCAVGCDARWDRWTSTSDFVMKYEKHYCGLCQRAYCARHTRVSPHGSKGRCDPESKCYCVTCHATLDRATREALERTNKLPPPSAALAGETSASRKAKSRWLWVRSNFRLRTGSCENLPLSPVNSSGNLLSPTK